MSDVNRPPNIYFSMFNKVNFLPVLNVILLIVFVAPLVYISKFVFLSTDDFCMAIKDFDSYGSNLREWYNYQNGRYINAIFALLPVYGLSIYKIIIASGFLLLGFALFWFVHRLFYSYDYQIGLQKKLLFAILLYIVLVAQLPSLFEMFYWYSAVGPYLYSFIFLLFFLGSVLKFFFKRTMNFYFFALVIIFLNGNNELLMILSNFLILLLFIWDWIEVRKLNKKLLLLNIISWASSLVLVLAPATALRRGLHVYGGDIWGSIKVAFIYGTKAIAINLMEIPYLICYFVVFLLIYNSIKNNKVSFIRPLHLFVISYLCVVSIFFIVYYATGLFGVYEGRMGNMTDITVFIFAFLNIFNFAFYLRFKGIRRSLVSRYYAPVLLSLLFIFILFKNENYVNIRKDIVGGDLIRYEEDMEERFQNLREPHEKTVLLEPVEGTRILKSGDKYYAGQDWLQYCYREYINSYLGKNFESIDINFQK